MNGEATTNNKKVEQQTVKKLKKGLKRRRELRVLVSPSGVGSPQAARTGMPFLQKIFSQLKK